MEVRCQCASTPSSPTAGAAATPKFSIRRRIIRSLTPANERAAGGCAQLEGTLGACGPSALPRPDRAIKCGKHINFQVVGSCAHSCSEPFRPPREQLEFTDRPPLDAVAACDGAGADA